MDTNKHPVLLGLWAEPAFHWGDSPSRSWLYVGGSALSCMPSPKTHLGINWSLQPVRPDTASPTPPQVESTSVNLTTLTLSSQFASCPWRFPLVFWKLNWTLAFLGFFFPFAGSGSSRHILLSINIAFLGFCVMRLVCYHAPGGMYMNICEITSHPPVLLQPSHSELLEGPETASVACCEQSLLPPGRSCSSFPLGRWLLDLQDSGWPLSPLSDSFKLPADWVAYALHVYLKYIPHGFH